MEDSVVLDEVMDETLIDADRKFFNLLNFIIS